MYSVRWNDPGEEWSGQATLQIAPTGQDLQGHGGEAIVSINSIMNSGLSALAANQQALKATSTNVANVNTVGYARLEAQLTSRGSLGGVEVDVQRVANAYLAAAQMRGAADYAASDILSSFMDRAQGLLGDPADSDSVFATLDRVFGSFGALATDPGSTLRRSSTVSELQTMLSQIDITGRDLQALRDEASSRAGTIVDEANALMRGIAKLNISIQSSALAGAAPNDADSEQQHMIDRLSEIIDIRTERRALGGVEVRTMDGMLLVDADAASLGQGSTSSGEPYPGVVLRLPRSQTDLAFDSHISGGELKGLLRVRDREIPNLQLAFSEYAAGAAEALNAAHNASSPTPAPASLTGRNTGLVDGDLLNFSGVTQVGVVDAQGKVLRNFRIDFDTYQVRDDQAIVTSFDPGGGQSPTVDDLISALNTAMGPDAAVSFGGGVMTLAANGAGAGVVIKDDPVNPALRAGRGFSHAFGLNDLVAHGAPLGYATGLSSADQHGFTAGALTFAIRNTDGAVLRTFDFTVTAGTTMGQLRTALNGALQDYGSASLDATGRMSLTPAGNGVGRIDVVQDTTLRGDTGLSMSELFGFGESLPIERSRSQAIRADILANPSRLAVAQADLAGAVAGQRVLSPGDGRGALAMEQAAVTPRSFADAGALGSQVASIIDYAARLAGQAGVRAGALEAAKTAAEAVRNEAKDRRMSEEGVNLDEELVKMTTYQQAYAAASRMITAARDLYDIVLNMV